MNSLEKYLATSRISWIEAMNQLQDQGIISDNCVGPADVAECDCEKAVKFLELEKAMLI